MTYVARFIGVLLLLMPLWLLQSAAYAQDNPTPFVDIVNVETNQAPTIQLSVVGGNLPSDLSKLPLQLFESDKAQTITADQTALAGIQLALVIDPHNGLAPGSSGQTHQAVAGAVLDLINNSVITRNVDLLAAYSLNADRTLQTIQDRTKEPNLIFNGIVQSKPAEIGEGAQLTDPLLQILDKFQAQSAQTQSPPLARSLLLFSTGTSSFDLTQVVAKAHDLNVYIHTVEMAAPNQPAGQANALQQLAQQTDGQYTFLTSPKNLAALWPLLSGLRTQRTVAYKSSSAAPAPIKLQFTLPNGSTITRNLKPASPATGPSKPAQPITATVSTTATTPTTAAVGVPATVAAVASATATSVTSTDNSVAVAPAADNLPPVEANQNDKIVIPGLGWAVPRSVLQLALPLLILLLAYFIYRDVRERKARTAENANLNLSRNSKGSRVYELSDPISQLKPLPKNRANAGNYPLQAGDELPVDAGEPLPSVRHTPRVMDDGQNEDATIVPRLAFGDDEATYRLSEQIEQPVVGYFVRVAGNPTLPNELPIYGLNPARGEVRQIHIGRHSKNNTVVINDKSISREHAVIVQKEGRLYLRDNASMSGTFLNGKRLQPGEELLLRHNDLTSFGEVVYEFHAKGEDEATVAGE